MWTYRSQVMLLAAVLAISGAACARDDAPVRRFELTGVMVGREASPARVVVAHDAVEAFMPAMTMSFEIRGQAPPVLEGDRINATLVVSDRHSWLEDVRIAGRGGAARVRTSSHSRAMPGAIVPALTLLDQSGRARTIRDFAGRVVIVTFIYTRCPLPDFCPLMIRHLEAVRRRANVEGLGERLALLGVTLDPEFDTPAVLHAYGEAVLEGQTRFDHWTLATGTLDQVMDAARFFGVASRADGAPITHTLTTAVVGHDGRVLRLFESNSWRPDDLFDVVRRAIDRAAAESNP